MTAIMDTWQEYEEKKAAKDSLPEPGTQVEITGSVVRDVYRSESFAVAIIKSDSQEITIVGGLPQFKTGEEITVVGKVVNNPRFGKQIKVDRLIYEIPSSSDGVERFLASGLIVGIGPSIAARIVKKFGENALDILDKDPDQYLKVSGIGPTTLKKITESWAEHRNSRELIFLLQQHDISITLAGKIIRTYEGRAGEIIRNNPYQIAYDITGVGFKRADSLARSQGFGDTDPRRIQAGLYFALNDALSEGHTYLPIETLIDTAAELLQIPIMMVDWAMHIMDTDNNENIKIDTIDGARVAYLRQFWHAEKGVAFGIHRLMDTACSRLEDIDLDSLQLDENLSDEQSQAVKSAFSTPVSLITGGPGCGKSFLIKAIVDILSAANHSYELAAPTGRAAKRMNESTGKTARTIHRLLGLGRDDGEDPEPIDVSMVIVDEVSMVDIVLMNKLIQAIPPGIHIVFVGDADQLPSVGAGNVLHDLINSGIIPVTRLTKVFRQSEGSAIVTNARRVNQGQQPTLDNQSTDFFFFSLPKERIAAEVLDLVATRIPEKFGITPSDIQVLTPMQKGENGVKELNLALQSRLNPAVDTGTKPTYRFRPRDRVMQTKNNYDKGVFNGDMGVIASIDPDAENHQVVVSFDGIGDVKYTMDELNEQIVLSYAITIHKSQGGEYPCALIVLSNEHYVMLQRNLLYTAITRAKRFCIIVGSRQAIFMSVQNNQVKKRNSGLIYRLQQCKEE